MVGGDTALPAALERVLEDEENHDNQRKLAALDVDERHLYVVIGGVANAHHFLSRAPARTRGIDLAEGTPTPLAMITLMGPGAGGRSSTRARVAPRFA